MTDESPEPQEAQALPEPPSEPDDDKVICPNCVHQFRAIPPNVQRLMLDAGFEPPFIATPSPTQAAPVQPTREEVEAEEVTDEQLAPAAARLITRLDAMRAAPQAAEARSPDMATLIEALAQSEATRIFDAARLDFLDQTNARFSMGWEIGQAPVGNLSVRSVVQLGKSPTPIRDAIDTAMRNCIGSQP